MVLLYHMLIMCNTQTTTTKTTTTIIINKYMYYITVHVLYMCRSSANGGSYSTNFLKYSKDSCNILELL